MVELEWRQKVENFRGDRKTVLIALAVSFFLFFFIESRIRTFRFKRKHGCKPPVSHPNSRRLGIPMLFEQLKDKREGRMLEAAVDHFHDANANTFEIRLLGFPIIMTQEPENIKALLATQFNDFSLGIRHAQFKPLLGDGIFTLDGEGWKQSRAMLRPQFSREQIAHVKALEPHFQTLVEHIDNKNGATFDIQELFFRLTMDTATEFLFGESVYTLRDGTVSQNPPVEIEGRDTFAEMFNLAQSYLSSRSYTSFLYFFINTAEFRNANKQVHGFTKYYVQKALSFTQEELDEKSREGYIFLYELAKQTKNPKILQDQLLNILLAGRDTTAGLLSYTFYELARNPDVYEKLKDEIYSAFGRADNARVEDITFESLKKCEYLKYVINEVLRLYPSVPVNFRVSVRDTTLPLGGGSDGRSPVYVPKGTTCAYSVHCTHRMEDYYGKDALEFRPERWANLSKVGWAYVPFNGGPRICLGQQFALTEASYIVTRLVQTFPHIESKDSGSYPPLKNVQLTLCLQNGAYISLYR